MPDQSLLGFIFNANIVVQVVLGVLLVASVLSWSVILQKWFYLGKASFALKRFEKQYSQTKHLPTLYEKLKNKGAKNEGARAIFWTGYTAFLQMRGKPHASVALTLDSAKCAMSSCITYEEEALGSQLSLLATVGSTSPYIGLFGTVWGIMMAFHALGAAAEVTIAMVAPGISGALIATAMGLFAAIPAVIFYNRYASRVDQLVSRYDAFAEALLAQLHLDVVSHHPSVSPVAPTESENAYA